MICGTHARDRADGWLYMAPHFLWNRQLPNHRPHSQTTMILCFFWIEDREKEEIFDAFWSRQSVIIYPYRKEWEITFIGHLKAQATRERESSFQLRKTDSIYTVTSTLTSVGNSKQKEKKEKRRGYDLKVEPRRMVSPPTLFSQLPTDVVTDSFLLFGANQNIGKGCLLMCVCV